MWGCEGWECVWGLGERGLHVQSDSQAVHDKRIEENLHCTYRWYKILLASFPGFNAQECKHWSCAGVESVVFFLTWEVVKDRCEVDATLIVRGRMRLRTEKGMKVAVNLLHVSSYWASNIIHMHWTLKHSWLNNMQNVAFLFLSCFDYAMLT